MYGGSDVIDPYHLHFTVTLNLKQAKNILVKNWHEPFAH